MSFRWPNKDPDETLDYSIDWSRYVGSASITNVVWYVDDATGTKTLLPAGAVVNGIQHVAPSTTGKVTTINLALGTNNTEYKFYCNITDSTGTVTERSVKLRVKEY